MKTHTQVSMVNGNVHDTSWIESKFAVKGKKLRIGQEEGWEVTNVGNMKVDSKYVEERKNDYRSQRQASDI